MDRLQLIDRESAYLNTERLKITHPLRQLFWECTLNCNLSCRHCGSDCRKEIRSSEMPIEDLLPVLDESDEVLDKLSLEEAEKGYHVDWWEKKKRKEKKMMN